MYLENKVAIVTDRAMGIGRAIAEGLASEGAAIILGDVTGAEEAANEMDKKRFKAIGVKVDVSSQKDTEKMAEEAIKTFKRIDILINNTGIYTSLIPGPFEKITVEEWRRVMGVNVMVMFLCSKAVIGEMRKNKEGRIINIAS